MNTRAPDAAQKLQGIAGGRSISSAARPPRRWASARCARAGATCSCGLFGGELTHPLPPIAQRAIGIIGSYVGNLQELKEVVALAKKQQAQAAAGRDRGPPIEANAALEDLKAGARRSAAWCSISRRLPSETRR